MKVRTLDLRPGDVLHYADLVETVVSVTPPEPPPTGITRVDTIRNGKPEWFMTGIEAEHDVTRPGTT